ncbi:hypothetical protein F5Y06DRAFT_272908 [Hypoxylon sp. FL0890]|nr:hypothetical protein F5Y06DRAFT_272908 [Hypoxylon sp. FL0890]
MVPAPPNSKRPLPPHDEQTVSGPPPGQIRNDSSLPISPLKPMPQALGRDGGGGGSQDSSSDDSDDSGPRRKPPPGPFRRLHDKEEVTKRREKALVKLQDYFAQDSSHFKFIGIVGQGLTNIACKVKLRNRWFNPYPSEYFILKRAVRANQENSLRRERRNLRRLRGALHVVQAYSPRIRIDVPDVILMENLENGSLWEFMERRRFRLFGELPNRLLYRLFMCLVRFGIAMAYPPNGPRDAELRREEIPRRKADRDNKSQLVHGDMHANNVLFGRLTANDWEHELTPILKLIDLERMGYAQHDTIKDPGVHLNVIAIGKLMFSLITGWGVKDNETFMDRAVVDGNWVDVETVALFPRGMNPHLDPELKSIVVRCLSTYDRLRPTLEELERVMSQGIKSKQSDYYAKYPLANLETDANIKLAVRSLIFDAPINPPP